MIRLKDLEMLEILKKHYTKDFEKIKEWLEDE